MNAGRDAAGGQVSAVAGAVVATIADHFSRPGWELQQHEGGTAMVAGLALGEQHDHGPPLAISDSVELGVQAALGAADAGGNAPFEAGWLQCDAP